MKAKNKEIFYCLKEESMQHVPGTSQITIDRTTLSGARPIHTTSMPNTVRIFLRILLILNIPKHPVFKHRTRFALILRSKKI